MHVNFVSSNDTGEVRTIFVWSNNKEIRFGNETDDIIKGLINSPKRTDNIEKWK